MAGWDQRMRPAARSAVRAAAMVAAPLRPFPDLVIIGVKRGGTTSLFRELERHPAMLPLVPSARRLPLRENQKGVHYFDSNSDRSRAWYRSHFPTEPARWLRRRRIGSAFTAEASPYYFFHPAVARRAAATLPVSTSFVVMLRDPVERTISHWAEQTRNGVETLSLTEALDAEPTRVGDDHRRLGTGEIATSHAHEQQSYAAQSHYADSLERWFDVVGRDRVVVVFSEDHYRDPASTLGSLTDRLGVAPVPAVTGEHRNAAPRAGAIEAELETSLVERFRPDVARVADLVGATPPWPRFDARAGSTPDRSV